MLDKDASYINKLEKGKINSSLKSIINISKVLETNIVDFFK